MKLLPDLTPRQIATGLDLLTGAVVVSVAVALAGLTWRIAGHAGMGAVTVPSGSEPVAMAPPDIALALAPFGKAALSEAAPATTLDLTLKGVVFAVPSTLSTAFIAVGDEEPKPLGIGDPVSGATIEAIHRDRVLLNKDGRIESLAFPDPFASDDAAQAEDGTAPAAPPAPSPTPPPSPAALIDRLDAAPVEGGYRIGDNAPPGLQPGDVIQAVNGTALDDPAAARAAFESAGRTGTAQIQILRDGRPITLTVPTR